MLVELPFLFAMDSFKGYIEHELLLPDPLFQFVMKKSKSTFAQEADLASEIVSQIR